MSLIFPFFSSNLSTSSSPHSIALSLTLTISFGPAVRFIATKESSSSRILMKHPVDANIASLLSYILSIKLHYFKLTICIKY